MIKSCLALAVAFCLCYAVAEQIFSILIAPLLTIRIPGLILIGTSVPEAFFTKLKVSFIAALFFSLPVILWQVWKFVAPGLYEHEKRYARGLALFGSLFFLLGAWFCYEVIFRAVYVFFLKRYQAIDVRPTIKIGEYLSFSARLILAFGVIFELPVAVYFLARIGLVDHRLLIRQFRYAIIVLLIIAAVLTPPDIVSQILLSGPLLVIYGISIGAAWLGRQKDREQGL